jgi:dTDP-4-amino-4,6-dideoxygalactose transaminase
MERRDELRSFLTARGIGTEVYYPIALHMQKCFADLGYQPQDCAESASAASDTLAIPIYPELSSEQIDRVVDCIVDFYRQ